MLAWLCYSYQYQRQNNKQNQTALASPHVGCTRKGRVRVCQNLSLQPGRNGLLTEMGTVVCARDTLLVCARVCNELHMCSLLCVCVCAWDVPQPSSFWMTFLCFCQHGKAASHCSPHHSPPSLAGPAMLPTFQLHPSNPCEYLKLLNWWAE